MIDPYDASSIFFRRPWLAWLAWWLVYFAACMGALAAGTPVALAAVWAV